MSEIMDERKRDAQQFPNRENAVNMGYTTPSFDDDFNSAFTKLEAMQDEIVAKKIAELEEILSELETCATKIINEKER